MNLSLCEGVMPEDLKCADLYPSIKKHTLDPEVLKHFRPVSNLPYVSKLVEMTVDDQVTGHMDIHELHDVMQSAYKQFHSTETAMVKLTNDTLIALDQGKAMIIFCIDMSSAFDTVHHGSLLETLEQRIGLQGTCLKWFESYLSNRKQSVCISGVRSSPRDLKYGVPQGSVLGPKLYNIYTLPLGEIIKRHGVYRILYADDGNMYIAFMPNQVDSTRERIEYLSRDLKSFFVARNLLSNDDKLVAMVVNGTRRQPIIFPPLNIGEAEVPMSLAARILGFEVDNSLSMSNHIDNVTRSCFYQLHKIYKIRDCIDEDAAKSMVHSLVTSRLDYCNAVLYGLPDTLLNRLWCVQKSAARLITSTRKYDHITPVMIKLHWLPPRERIEFKILLLTYKALNGKAPVYISDMLQRRSDKGTRNDNKLLLVDPRMKRVTFGGRSFTKAAPVLWNNLPMYIKTSDDVSSFKDKVKTFLFRKAYNC